MSDAGGRWTWDELINPGRAGTHRQPIFNTSVVLSPHTSLQTNTAITAYNRTNTADHGSSIGHRVDQFRPLYLSPETNLQVNSSRPLATE